MRVFDDVPLHPRVRQALLEGNRDRPLTLNWKPVDKDAFGFLGLRKLTPLAERAKKQIISEAVAAGRRKISYSRARTFYTHGQRYHRDTYRLSAVVPAVDQLAEAGLLGHEKSRPGQRGIQSRFYALPVLLEETARIAVVYTPLEIILVRDEHGNPVDYRDNRLTRVLRGRLETLNEALIHQAVGVDGQIIREGDLIESGRAQIQMHRVFNRANIESGGRFYGSFFQSMGDRHRLTINGQPTIEVDYAGMHIAMLYAEIGKPMPTDPYDLGGWPRRQAKLALLIIINAPTHTSAVRALADALRLEGGIGDPFKAAQALLTAVKSKHPDIAHAFGSDAGIRLMRKDSEIAEKVMLEMLRATGVVPLCVHYSFIVPASHKEELKRAMQDASLPVRPKFPFQETLISLVGELKIGDNFSQEFSEASPENDLQYGMDSGSCSGAALDLVTLVVWRARLDDLSVRLARFKPHIIVNSSAVGSEFTSAKS
jgi:hypothetical protein